MPELKIRYGDCPICGKAVVYQGGQYCGPACWGYANPPYPGQAPRQAATVPLGADQAPTPATPTPKKAITAAPPPLPTVKRWEPVPKRVKVAPSAPKLPDVGTETDLVDYLASLE